MSAPIDVFIVRPDDNEIAEGETRTLEVRLSEASDFNVSVDFVVRDNYLTDLEVVGNSRLVFAPGVTSQTVQVRAIDDDLYEGREFAQVRLENAVGANGANLNGVSLFVSYSDEPDVVLVSFVDTGSTPFQVAEGGTLDFELQLSRPASETVTVQLDRGFSASDQFDIVTPTVTFAPGETRATATITVPDDTAYEPIDFFNRIEIVSATNATIRLRSDPRERPERSPNFDILESDVPTGPIVSLEETIAFSENLDLLEGETYDLRVVLSEPSTTDVTVRVAIRTPDASGASIPNPAVTIPAGETSALIAFEVTDDTARESSEYLQFRIEEVTGDATASLDGGERSATYGIAANDRTYEGTELGEAIYGDRDDNEIFGRSGDDLLVGREGRDRLFGGSGDDTYAFNTGDEVIEAVGAGYDTIRSIADVQRFDNVERVVLVGSRDIDATGNNDANVLVGNQGDNVLSGLAGADVLIGGAGDDLLRGGAGNDIMRGGTGDDIYVVQDAGDRVQELAGEGDDVVNTAFTRRIDDNVETMVAVGEDDITLVGSGDADRLFGNIGDNRLFGEGGDDRLFGRDGDDLLRGGGGDDTLRGGAGDDVLNGGNGGDVMLGGTGDDVYIVNSVDDVVTEERDAGRDLVIASATFVMPIFVEVMVAGGGGDIILLGSTRDDVLRGNEGDNRLIGRGGNDIIEGGAGADVLIGGEGADQFVYRDASDSGVDAFDRVVGFESGADRVVLTPIDAVETLAGDQGFRESNGDARYAPGELELTQIATGTLARADVDGDGAFDLQILFVDAALTYDDFVL